MKLRIIYLAAGNSRRFGSNKLMYEIEGKPMYRHLLERLCAIAGRHPDWQLFVVSQYRELLEQCADLPVILVDSPDSPKGVSYSIRAGILGGKQNAEKESMPEAYAFFVADQPWLSEETAEAFLTEMESFRAPLGSVCFQGTPGNPTWFSSVYVPDLLALLEDQGGRRVLRGHEEEIRWFPIGNEMELWDVDTREAVTRSSSALN